MKCKSLQELRDQYLATTRQGKGGSDTDGPNNGGKRKVTRKSGKFPAKPYVDLVLGPNYIHSIENHLFDMRQLNIAHVLMLRKQGLLSEDLSASILSAILDISYEKCHDRKYSGESEDLYFEIEKEIIERTGPLGGFIHLARSRNDLGATLQRMLFRDKLLSVMESLVELCGTVLACAAAYKDTLTIAHTHSQQAQPTVLGHYFLGAFDLLSRDFQRMLHAYGTIDLCPMGAAAITTSGFSIDRKMMAELSGFSHVMVNSYDAIAGADFVLEYAASIGIAATDLGRVVSDLLLWSTQEFGILHLDDSVIQVSSIMPQKRNPVAFEHSRALLSQVGGKAIALQMMLHNTPYGDIVDTEDDAASLAVESAMTLGQVYRLLAFLLATMTVDVQVLDDRLKGSFSVITELADTLVRNEGVSFRDAHGVASSLVSECLEKGLKLDQVTYPMICGHFEKNMGRPLRCSEEIVLKSLSARHFVDVRTVQGGPSALPMEEMLSDADNRLVEMHSCVAAYWKTIASAAERCEEQAALVAGNSKK